jgi:hypothetical protein
MGNKVSDEWAVPLCFTHHRALHTVGNEEAWWVEKGIDAKAEALRLWRQSHGFPEPAEVVGYGEDGRMSVGAAPAPINEGSGAQQRPRHPQTHSVIVPDAGEAAEGASATSAAK